MALPLLVPIFFLFTYGPTTGCEQSRKRPINEAYQWISYPNKCRGQKHRVSPKSKVEKIARHKFTTRQRVPLRSFIAIPRFIAAKSATRKPESPAQSSVSE